MKTVGKRFLLILAGFALAWPSAAENWPQFRGSHRDNISQETGLLREWPDSGPEVLWTLEVEQGYSGPAIFGGKVFFNDYSSATSEWLVRAVSLETGEELWTFREKRRIRPNHGISRTVPATDGKIVFAFDPKAVLHALDAETGAELWRKNLVQDYASKIPPWYNGQCPLIEDDRVVIATGGSALMVALDKATGDEIWRSENPEGWPLSHASVMPAKLAGVDQYLYNTLMGTHGVSRADGKLLWHYPFKFNVAVAPSPLAVDGNRVFITAGYDSGGALIEISGEGDSLKTKKIFGHDANEWNSEIHTPIVFDDHLFAVDKKKRGQFTCIDREGKQIWSSTPVSFDMGSFLLADGMFFILDGKTGLLRLLEASTTEYKELAKAQVLSGHDVWGPMALSGGTLVLRDMAQMKAVRVGAK